MTMTKGTTPQSQVSLTELGPCTIDELIAEDVFGVDEQAVRTAVAGLVATGRATIDDHNTVTPC